MPILPLYGHEALRERLSLAMRRGTLPASLLLHGPRGVGKQRLALWIAQSDVCAADERPCDRCESCRFALELAHPDVRWFFPRARISDTTPSAADVLAEYAEAAAERARAGGLYGPADGTAGIYVATVRAIVQRASVSPAMARRKVFIIGDAERMVPQEGSEFAANALLKQLEEPPADTRIILTSSEPGALLPTIRSRVAAVRVAPLPPADVDAFLGDPAVRAALHATKRSRAELVESALGAPGRLLQAAERADSTAAAQRLLEAALSGDRARTLQAAVAQGGSRARGAFADTLDALVALLAERSRAAAARGDERAAAGASRAVASVEHARALASGNVSPSLITATMLRDLATTLR